jgi:hypothetical protein
MYSHDPLSQERKEDNRISPQVGVVEGCQYKVVLCNTLDMEQIAPTWENKKKQ